MPEMLGEIAIWAWVVFMLCATAAPRGGRRG
jgi:hypothetical protein